MNDRQLLELAAKAAGYGTSHSMNAERLELSPPVISLLVRRDGKLASTAWNPLTDDGDALRLVMTLDMSVNCNRDELTVIVQTWRPKPIKAVSPKLFKAVRNNVKDADVRRCIVEVAAMIGKEMR